MKLRKILCTEMEITGAELKEALEAHFGRLDSFRWGAEGSNLLESVTGFIMRVNAPASSEPCGCEPFAGEICEKHATDCVPEIDREAGR